MPLTGQPSTFDEMYGDAARRAGEREDAPLALPPGTNPYAGQVAYARNSKTRKYTGNSVDLVNNLPYRWKTSKDKREKAQLDKFYRHVSNAAGRPIKSFDEALEIWQKAVAKAEGSWTGTRGGKKGRPTTPWDELVMAARDRQAGIVNTLSGGVGGTSRSVAKSVDEISDGTAWTYIDRAAQEMLGRAPTDDELRRFISRAQDVASRNPNVTTITATDDGSGTTRERRETKQGADAGDYMLAARNMAATPEAAAYQAATTYMNALIEATNSTVDLQNPVG